MTPLPTLDDTIECSCETCVSACYKKPGWFLPNEIKPAADLLGISEEEFFNKFLGVDYYGNPNENLYVLSPATLSSPPGQEFPLDPTGQCVFLKEGKCSIHAAKPYECRSYDHRDKVEDTKAQHLAVAEAWIPYKDKIVHFLGREPKVETPNFEEGLEFLFKMLRKI